MMATANSISEQPTAPVLSDPGLLVLLAPMPAEELECAAVQRSGPPRGGQMGSREEIRRAARALRTCAPIMTDLAVPWMDANGARIGARE